MRTIGLFAALVWLAVLACDSGSGEGEKKTDTGLVEDAVGETGDAVVPEETTVGPEEVAVELPPADLGLADEVPPEAALPLEPFAAIPGQAKFEVTWSDDVGVAKVELLLEGEPACEIDPETGEADTTALPHGVQQIGLRVTDAAGNAVDAGPVTVVLAGPGQFLPYTDMWKMEVTPGWGGGSVFVAHSAVEVPDQKAHVTMPAGMKTVVAWLRWDSGSEWNLGFDIGTGNCPHSGQLLAFGDLDAAQGLIEVEYDDAGKDLLQGKWFGHIRFEDGIEHKGETLVFGSLFLALP